jgi:hypothetical protein
VESNSRAKRKSPKSARLTVRHDRRTGGLKEFENASVPELVFLLASGVLLRRGACTKERLREGERSRCLVSDVDVEVDDSVMT